MVIQCIICKKPIDDDEPFLCPNCGRLPIPLDPLTLIEEMILLSKKLNIKMNSLIQFYKDSKIPQNDEKYQSISNLSLDVIVLIYQLRKILFLGNNLQVEISENLGDIDTFFYKRPDEIFTKLDLNLKRNFLTDFLFHIQGFLKAVNQGLREKHNDHGYVSLVENILKDLDIGDKDSEKL